MAAVGLNVVRETLWGAGRRACHCSRSAILPEITRLDSDRAAHSPFSRPGLLARVGPFAVAVAAEASLMLPPGHPCEHRAHR
jgi:hypothetical protein